MFSFLNRRLDGKYHRVRGRNWRYHQLTTHSDVSFLFERMSWMILMEWDPSRDFDRMTIHMIIFCKVTRELRVCHWTTFHTFRRRWIDIESYNSLYHLHDPLIQHDPIEIGFSIIRRVRLRSRSRRSNYLNGRNRKLDINDMISSDEDRCRGIKNELCISSSFPCRSLDGSIWTNIIKIYLHVRMITNMKKMT